MGDTLNALALLFIGIPVGLFVLFILGSLLVGALSTPHVGTGPQEKDERGEDEPWKLRPKQHK